MPNKKTVVIATGNAHKVEEIVAILAAVMPNTRFVSIREVAPSTYTEPEETGSTFLENACIKARAGWEATHLPTIADDSGLVVDALGGAPGIYSARFSGAHGDNVANRRKVLKELGETPLEERTARFVCAAAYIDDNGKITAEGTCEGRIIDEERGSFGFGYDPIFESDAYPGQTTAEITPEQKNAISHRGRALTQLAEQLKYHNPK